MTASATEHVLSRLSDGGRHTPDTLAQEIDVSVNAIYQAVRRLRMAGTAIVWRRGTYTLGEHRCAVCGVSLRRRNHTERCSIHARSRAA